MTNVKINALGFTSSNMSKKCYIYYTFDSLTSRNVNLSIESILGQEFSAYDTFVLFNQATTIESDGLIGKTSCLKERFKEFVVLDNAPNAKSVAKDIHFQIDNIGKHDFYFCHKADFVLNSGMLAKTDELAEEKKPFYESFPKFDLREYADDEYIRKIAGMSFDEIASMDDACPTIKVPDFGFKYKAIGYAGHDGTMHCYNEEARKRIKVSSYWRLEDVEKNLRLGIDMRYGNKNLYVIHVFHAIDRADPRKKHRGHRF